MKLWQATFATAVFATALFGASGCSSSSASSTGPVKDAGVSGDAAANRPDVSAPRDDSGTIDTGNDSGVGDDAAPTSCDGGHFGAPDTHRAAAVACPATTARTMLFPDGGPSCTTDSECADAGGGPRCLHGQCSFDQCLVDADCAAGSTCGCANSYYGGNAIHGNGCFTSNCRVDSDCGSGGYCSPSFGAYCGGLTGFYCHKAADTCVNDTDCSCTSSRGGTCHYEPTVSHWQCEAAVVCSG
jgi:hypothetical protein